MHKHKLILLALVLILPAGLALPAERVPGAAQAIAWTASPPTTPGDYLYAYRFFPADDWTEGRMAVTPGMLPMWPDGSETWWYGPVPGFPGKPKVKGGGGA